MSETITREQVKELTEHEPIGSRRWETCKLAGISPDDLIRTTIRQRWELRKVKRGDRIAEILSSVELVPIRKPPSREWLEKWRERANGPFAKCNDPRIIHLDRIQRILRRIDRKLKEEELK